MNRSQKSTWTRTSTRLAGAGRQEWEPPDGCSLLLGKNKSPKPQGMVVKAANELWHHMRREAFQSHLVIIQSGMTQSKRGFEEEVAEGEGPAVTALGHSGARDAPSAWGRRGPLQARDFLRQGPGRGPSAGGGRCLAVSRGARHTRDTPLGGMAAELLKGTDNKDTRDPRAGQGWAAPALTGVWRGTCGLHLWREASPLATCRSRLLPRGILARPPKQQSLGRGQTC